MLSAPITPSRKRRRCSSSPASRASATESVQFTFASATSQPIWDESWSISGATIAQVDPPPGPPTISIAATKADGSEAGNSDDDRKITYTVTRTGESDSLNVALHSPARTGTFRINEAAEQ